MAWCPNHSSPNSSPSSSRWWDDLEKKQYRAIMQDDYVPDDQNDYGRGRLVTKEMLKVKSNQTKPNQSVFVRESKAWPL